MARDFTLYRDKLTAADQLVILSRKAVPGKLAQTE